MIIHQIRKLPREKVLGILSFLALAIGVAVRTWQYFQNESLFLDEAWVAMEATNRSFLEIFRQNFLFEISSRPPLLFILLLKVSTQLFGNNELALRLVPFLFSLAALGFFYQLARTYLSGYGFQIALWLFAIAEPLVFFSSEVRRYSVSVFVSVLLLFLASRLLKQSVNWKRLLSWGILGAAMLWLAHSAIFVLTAIGITMTYKKIEQKRWSGLPYLLIPFVLIFGSFLLLYNFTLKDVVGSQQLKESWDEALWIEDPLSWKTIPWIVEVFLDSILSPGGLGLPLLMAAIMGGGVAHFIKKDRMACLLLGMPVVLTSLAALGGIFPFRGRVILFLMPAYYIFLAQGAEVVAQKVFKYNRIAMAVLLSLIFYAPVLAVCRMDRSRLKPDNRSALEFFNLNYHPGDAVFLNTNKRYAFWYYAGTLGYGKFLPEYEGFDLDGSSLDGKRVGVFSEFAVEVLGQKIIGLVYEYHLYDQNGRFRRSVFRTGESVFPITKGGNHPCPKPGRSWIFLKYPRTQRVAEVNDIILSYFEHCGPQLQKFEKPGAAMYLYDVR